MNSSVVILTIIIVLSSIFAKCVWLNKGGVATASSPHTFKFEKFGIEKESIRISLLSMRNISAGALGTLFLLSYSVFTVKNHKKVYFRYNTCKTIFLDW